MVRSAPSERHYNQRSSDCLIVALFSLQMQKKSMKIQGRSQLHWCRGCGGTQGSLTSNEPLELEVARGGHRLFSGALSLCRSILLRADKCGLTSQACVQAAVGASSCATHCRLQDTATQ